MINAIEALTAIAETGDADAKLQLATILLADNITNNNRELQCLKAVTLLTDLASQDNEKAKALLGKAYAETGKACYSSFPSSKEKGAKALEWLTKAVQVGYKQAYYDLGMICMRGGNGLKPDMAAAEQWLLDGKLEGDKDSVYALSKLCLGLTHEDEEYARKAIRWLTINASDGHTASQRELGMIYLLGTYTETDYEESAYWFGKLFN